MQNTHERELDPRFELDIDLLTNLRKATKSSVAGNFNGKIWRLHLDLTMRTVIQWLCGKLYWLYV